jgi:hypothetical protein
MKMQYFTSIENTSYMRWQLKLLWQSMKMLGIENDLLVGICDTTYEKPQQITFCKTYKHENIGEKIQYLPINKPFSLMNAVFGGLLKQPFTVIDADMVFLKPITTEDASVASQYVWYMEWLFLQSIGWKLPRETWKPIGCVYQFNDVSNSLFEEIYFCCANLARMYKQGDKKLKIEEAYWFLEMLAFALPLINSSVKIVNHFQMPLNPQLPNGEKDSKDACLIHYCNGYKPWFSKHKFHPGNKEYNANFSPLKDILSIPSENKRVKALQNVVFKEVVWDYECDR